jgi:hypothetical protein
MKKDFIFAPLLIVIAALLFLLDITGIGAHIAISVVGAIVLIAYTVLAKKQWKIPALEIVMRAFYGIALVSGIVINSAYSAAGATVHKISCVLFVALLVAILVHKLVTAKKN